MGVGVVLGGEGGRKGKGRAGWGGEDGKGRQAGLTGCGGHDDEACPVVLDEFAHAGGVGSGVRGGKIGGRECRESSTLPPRGQSGRCDARGSELDWWE